MNEELMEEAFKFGDQLWVTFLPIEIVRYQIMHVEEGEEMW